MPSFVQTLAKLPARSKAIIAVSGVAIIAIAFLMLRIAGAPTYTTLASGLDPAQTGKITAALDEQGIAYELRSNGTALAVEKASVARARIALAEQGVEAGAGGSEEGFELFDKQKLGASDFQQKVTYQRALEGEIANTIKGVQGVTGVQVQLVLPEEDLFADNSSPATAAVMLAGSSDQLESGAVRGIAQLVSSSVKGLKTENVTITDGSGQLLWPLGDAVGGAGGGAGGTTKQAAEMRYERALQASLAGLLSSTLGPGKAQVQVKADINVDKISTDELTYAKKGTPLKETTESEQLQGQGSTGGGGTAGTGSNVPSYAQGGGASTGGNGNYDRNSTTTDFGVDKKVTRTQVAPGGVKRQQVALLLDKSVPASAIPGIKATVASAAGLDTARGDVIQVAQIAFAKPAAEPKAGPVPVSLLGPLKWVGLSLALLIFCFFMVRFMKRRENETLAEPSWLLDRPTPLAALEAEAGGRNDAPTQALTTTRRPEVGMLTLEELAEREPERVAAQVRAWMSED